jgi:hypothetical protein
VGGSFLWVMISAGFSNMLKDRRNCFLGRKRGFDGRRAWLIGEPLRTTDMLNDDCFVLWGGITAIVGLLETAILFSWGGDSMKHSPSDMEVDVDSLLLPAPKRKGGSCISGRDRCGTAPVECPFVLASPGRSNIDFLLL